jgi:hypothetical protein
MNNRKFSNATTAADLGTATRRDGEDVATPTLSVGVPGCAPAMAARILLLPPDCSPERVRGKSYLIGHHKGREQARSYNHPIGYR